MHDENILRKIKRTVLVVDDELVNQEILKSILECDYEILTAENGIEALHILETSATPISIILLDMNMPVMDGAKFIGVVKNNEKFKQIPIIVLTVDRDSELKSLELGAVDFIAKPYNMPEVVRARVTRSVELFESRTLIQATERDELTGLYNSHVFLEYVQKIDQYQHPSKMDMVVFNINRFHLFNLLYGIEEGDRVVCAVAEVLKDLANKNEGIVGRLESDYFAVYLTHQEDYGEVLEQLKKNLSENKKVTNIKLHFGVFEVVSEEDSVAERIENAKLVCDEISQSNKQDFCIFDRKTQKDTLFKERLTHEMEKALAEGQFEVYYQPKYDITGDTPKLSSAEALIRWIHPEYGFISPGDFIPLFEQNGSIRLLDNFVWNEAAKKVAEWKSRYHRTIPVSVNVSRIDLFDKKLCATLKSIVENAGLDTTDLLLEITESAYNNEKDQLVNQVKSLKDAGFVIEIDDFGSGYSSLNTLASISFDVIKLDMEFVREMEKNPRTMKMVQLVADLGGFLGTPIVAEGVETKSQLDTLKSLGYAIIQGYYFSKPVKALEFEEFIKREL